MYLMPLPADELAWLKKVVDGVLPMDEKESTMQKLVQEKIEAYFARTGKSSKKAISETIPTRQELIEDMYREQQKSAVKLEQLEVEDPDEEESEIDEGTADYKETKGEPKIDEFYE